MQQQQQWQLYPLKHATYVSEVQCLLVIVHNVLPPCCCSEALPPIEVALRDPSELEEWGPTVQELTEAEMEKKMRDQDRNTRRIRRLQVQAW